MSDAVIAVSRHTADHLAEVEGAPRERIHVVMNGIDFDRVRPSSPEAPGRVRQALGLAQSHLLLTAARLHPEKGYEYLFPALVEVRKRVDRRVVLAVAGTGPMEARYRESVRALGLDAEVRFLGFRRDIADVMSAADLFVLPSVAEAFGLVLAEALYLGVPVVATRVGGIPEIVDDDCDGLLVPPGDSSALAGAIAALLNDPQRRLRLAGAGSEKVKRRFGFEGMVRSYERIYESLVIR